MRSISMDLDFEEMIFNEENFNSAVLVKAALKMIAKNIKQAKVLCVSLKKTVFRVKSAELLIVTNLK